MSNGGLTMTIDTSVLRAYIDALPGKLDAGLRAATELMTNEMKLSMGTSPAGESYTRGSVTHVASSPGFPPNPDIGALLGSIRGNPAGHLRYEITDGVAHGYYQEFGTETIEKRPWMIPVFERWKQGLFQDHMIRMLA